MATMAQTILEYLTPGDAAPLLGLTPAGVRFAADQGRLKVAAMTAGGKLRLFLRADVERFAKARAKARR